MITELNLWAAQDALLEELAKREEFDQGGADEVALTLGFPADIMPEHVWIDGGATGTLAKNLTGAHPSDETFRCSVFVFVQAPDYVTARDRLATLADAVGSTLASDAFADVVPAWDVPEYRVDTGTDGSNTQVCLELTVECRCW